MSVRERLLLALREAGRVAQTRPAVGAGVRTSLAVIAPLILAQLWNEPELAWMAIGGFVAGLLDAGDGFRARAANLMAITAAGGAAATTAALLGDRPGAAVAGAGLWAFGGALLRVYGPIGGNAGLISSVIFVVSLAHPVPLPEAVWRGAWVLLGGASVAMLTLPLLPMQARRTSQRAVARCYAALGEYIEAVAERVAAQSDRHCGAQVGFEAVREALDSAWKVLASGPGWREDRANRRERLAVLLASADQMLGTMFALEEVSARVSHPSDARQTLRTALAQLHQAVARIAADTEQMQWPVAEPPRWTVLRLDVSGANSGQRAAVLQAEHLLWSLRELADVAFEAVAGFRFHPRDALPSHLSRPRGWQVHFLRSHLSAKSLVMRHALRVGVTVGIAVVLSYGVGPGLGYWIPLTTLFILQPYTSLTWIRGFQRVLGTVLGGVVAALIPLLVRDPVVILSIIFVLVLASIAVWPLNYALFAFFVTPTFVLLAELQAGVWTLHEERVLYTLAGAALALAGSRLLWSAPERKIFPAHAAAVVEGARSYLRALVQEGFGGSVENSLLPDLRRAIGVAVIEASASFQRLLLESGASGSTEETYRTILVYLRRLAAAAVAIAAVPPPAPADAQSLQRFLAEVDIGLAGVAAALVSGRSPGPGLPRLAPEARDPLLRAAQERLSQLVRGLYDAAGRALEAR